MGDEKWKSLDDYPNYSVSDWGRVRNNISGNFISSSYNGSGYLKVTIWSIEKRNTIDQWRKTWYCERILRNW